MVRAQFVFWVCLALVAYTYLFYPIFLLLAYALSQAWRDLKYLGRRPNRRTKSLAAEQLPSVSLIVAAHNEEACLPEKIANLRQLDYPREKLEIIFVSDGSTDRTNEILQAIRDSAVRTALLPVRCGKAVALNEGVAAAKHDLLIFSDAATLFAPGALQSLVRHFSDPQVGVVCGSLQFQGSSESQHTEGVYWKYESMLRLMEARLGATLTASGALYGLRRQCYPHLKAGTWVEDFVVPMHARKLGFRVVYDPEAVAHEFAAPSVKGEFARRVRIARGSFRALAELSRVPLNGVTCWAFFSHKFLRWTLPFWLVGCLVSNAFLLSSQLYAGLCVAQLLFYGWAGAGLLFYERLQRVRYALVGYFLLAIHVAFLVGFVRFLGEVDRGEASWHRVS